MRISVITVCYNAAKTIRGTCESVARQVRGAGLEVEHLVVDGGSTDRTVEEIKNCELRVKDGGAGEGFAFKWISEKDQGMYDALNKGVRMATGDAIGILNADDRFADECVLADVAREFETQRIRGSESGTEVCDAVYGDVRFVRGEGSETVRYYSSKPWKRWMHYWGYMPAHPTVYVRREVFERCGGYKLGYDISADFEWMTRVLCNEGVKAKYLPRCMVTMRLGGKSTAGLKAMWRLNCENVRANRENGYFCCLPMMLPKYLYKILGYWKKETQRLRGSEREAGAGVVG